METTTENTTNATQKASWQAIDPSTLGRGFYAEAVEIDEGADSFAIAPPLPEGKYLATIQLSTNPSTPAIQGISYAAKIGRDGQNIPAKNVLRVNTELTVVQPVGEGTDPAILAGRVKNFTKGFATQTRKTAFGNASEAVTLLNYLDVHVPTGTDAELVVQTLCSVLQREPKAIVGVELVWKAGFTKDKSNPADFGTWAVIGMRKFPLGQNGQYSPVTAVNGQEFHAKAYISRLFNPRA